MKIRPAQVIALAVAGALLFGSVVFVFVATADRNDAADSRQQAVQKLHEQRAATQDAEDQLTAARSARQATITQIGGIIASTQGLADIWNQGIDAARTTQSIGSSENPSVGDYNAAIENGNALADQIDAATQVVRDKIQSISRDLARQVA